MDLHWPCSRTAQSSILSIGSLSVATDNEVLPQDTTHLIQRPWYQRESPFQDPAGNWTTRRPLTIIKRHKLQWYGHVSCSSGLAKTVLQGTVKGRRRQGRQRKRWEDSVREWTGLEFNKSQRAVENREKWRKLVAKSSVVPQRPRRLRDWWWWWWCIVCLVPDFDQWTQACFLIANWH